MRRAAWLAALPAAALLFWAARDLPSLGDPDSPASRHVSPRYIERARAETGADNMVTAVLADYRGFDTLGETLVVFAAGIACMLLLLGGHATAERRPAPAAFGSPVLDAAVRLLTPFLMLFAAYVLAHGHDSPGGGFQGGAVLAGALILVRLVHGRDVAWGLRPEAAVALACGGALLYAGIGAAALAFGGSYLDYSALPLPAAGAAKRALSTLVIEASVFIAVTGVLSLIFYCLAPVSDDDAAA